MIYLQVVESIFKITFAIP